MRLRFLLLLAPFCLFMACRTTDSRSRGQDSPPTVSLAEFVKKAERFNAVVSLPVFETTPEAIERSLTNAIAAADAALDEIGARAVDRITFDNTLRALDHIGYRAGLTANRIYLLKETSTNAAVRESGTEAIKRFEEWAVGLDYREDVYRAVQAYADTKPALEGADKKYFEDVLRDYRRAGLHLPKPQRDEVERLRKELSALATDFDRNVTKATHALKFTRAELEGVPEDFFSAPGVKTGEDEYTVMANITWQVIAVMENARREATRRRLLIARQSLAREENAPLLQKILEVRHTIARKLGYDSWADYRTEPKMARTAAIARDFVENLKDGLEPKFQAELREYRRIKVRETGDADARVESWDWRYLSNQLKKEEYAVDAEKLRDYFPYHRVLRGMFRIYEHIFGLTIARVEAPQKWVEDLELYAVADAGTGEPMGLFYLDMFPREGKYNHFAQFGIIEGARLPDGRYQRPTVALICNFPAPRPDQPSLLSHSDVETLFHEFGHAMHSILTRADYAGQAGTSVPRDFVEAPSQMLENWVWDKGVLDSFAAHYENLDEKIPQEILDQLKSARLATIGTFYRRQLSFGLLDLVLHMEDPAKYDCVEMSNQILSEVFLPVPEGTSFVTYFGHLTGYDAGYYGYAWADAIAADMATVFENAPEGYWDQAAGRRLREEIYAPGDSRDVNESIRKFLGRERSLDPFLKSIGIASE